MKKGNFSKLVLLSGALAFPAYAEKVQLEQLPSDLQEKIRAQVGGNRVEDIDRQTKGGKTIYEVAFKDNGQHREVQIEHSSSPAAPSSSAASSGSQKITFGELPENVRRSAESYIKDGEVNDVDRQVKDGRTTYEIGYKVRDGGAQRELLLSENGELLNQSRTTQPASRAAHERPRVDRGVPINRGQADTTALRTRSVDYNQLPANVRGVAESRLREGGVTSVKRVIQGGDISYEINFKKEDGRTQQLVVAEDGRVIRDQFISATDVGSSATTQSGNNSDIVNSPASRSNDYSTSPVVLRNSQEITRAQLPVGVARAVRGYTTNDNIDEIRRGTWQGQSIYEITYTEGNNQAARLQLDDRGQIIYDPRAAGSSTSTSGNVINNIGRALLNSGNNN